MLTTLTVAAVALVAPPELDLALRVRSTEFLAVNPTSRPEIVFLTDGSGRVRGSFVVPPQSSVRCDVPAGAWSDLALVAATRCERGIAATGAWSLERLAQHTDDFVWLDVERGASHAWMRHERGFAPLAPEDFSVPPPAFLSSRPGSKHVPSITPHDARAADVPPRLERTPLPPV
jgi:hypothetical protein